MNNETRPRANRSYRTPVLLGFMMLLLAAGATGLAEAASVNIGNSNSTAKYAMKTDITRNQMSATAASTTAQTTRTPGGNRTPTSGCQFAILSYHECLNGNGCTTFSIPVQNTGSEAVVVDGTVEIQGQGNRVLGTIALQPTTIAPEGVTYVTGTVCITEPDPRGPYQLIIRLRDIDRACEEKTKSQPLRSCEVATETPEATNTVGQATNTVVPPTSTVPQSTNTAVSTSTPGTSCDCRQDVNVIGGGIRIVGNRMYTTFRNNSQTCSHLVGVASYQMINNNFEDQVLFDFEQRVLQPGETATLSAEIPQCRYQLDAFCGEVIYDFHGGVRYGDRLLDTQLGGTQYCQQVTPTATSVPSNTSVPTNTVAVATNTATVVPTMSPSATATIAQNTATVTATRTATVLATMTSTVIPSATSTRTQTAILPTITSTVLATMTSMVVPSSTSTITRTAIPVTGTATSTIAATATGTVVVATSTPQMTNTATSTPIPATNTPQATNTVVSPTNTREVTSTVAASANTPQATNTAIAATGTPQGTVVAASPTTQPTGTSQATATVVSATALPATSTIEIPSAATTVAELPATSSPVSEVLPQVGNAPVEGVKSPGEAAVLPATGANQDIVALLISVIALSFALLFAGSFMKRFAITGK